MAIKFIRVSIKPQSNHVKIDLNRNPTGVWKARKGIASPFLILAVGFGLLRFCADELYMLNRQQYPPSDTQADSTLHLGNSSMGSVGSPPRLLFSKELF